MTSPADEIVPASDAQRGGRRVFWWGLVLTAAWILYEFTSQPMLGIIVGCLKCGWKDFLTAIWLRRSDPNRARGAACSWFYLAEGAGKVLGASLGVMFAIILVFDWLNIRDVDRTPPLAAIGILALTGFALFALLILSGCLSARIWHVRVWIDGTVLFGYWDPRSLPCCRGVTNHLNVLRIAWILVVLPGLFVGAAAMEMADHPWAWVGLTLIEIQIIIALWRNVVAASPGECWDSSAEWPEIAAIGSTLTAAESESRHAF